MTIRGFKNHPYIPNSDLEVQREMLEKIGLKSLDELHAEVPEELKLKRPLNLPKPFESEYELKRGIDKILRKNISSKEYLNFLGAGCWQHYVPAVCDEINSRSEFLTAYAGEPYNDHGRFQTLFEYESLLAELLDMDVVNVPTFDWAQGAATSLRMSSRITERSEALVVGTISTERLMIIKNYCDPGVKITLIDYDKETGKMDLEDLRKKISDNTAAVYFENPSYLGFIEDQGAEISKIAHEAGAISVVGVDPSSLGVIAPPSSYGADIICGDLQPLGMHMNYGGGQSGFISTRDEERFVMEYPSRLFGVAPTIKEGEYGFGDIAYERTSFGNLREKGKEYVGTQTALLGITAGVYLSLMGPKGMVELGQNIIQKSLYAIEELSKVKGVKGSRFNNIGFKEFVVDFNNTGKTVNEINKKLLDEGIFGGKDLSEEFPELGQSALYCVTEVHLKEDIDTLVNAIRKIIEG
ncbi:glycine dehydrogenase subunit 1 [Tissierella praeacuta DSM 18095]|uniref:Glycine dehydrogenase subunit 1 n=1 Tax=Tissierella praeacuta DSM 18095 TaxID=1123404 RepID=A0A1M4VQ88_9FIRM|nr:aminomethyl-transferring glycine dehydrogenase subunit GcvPA [Tissierella praeacuta]TCU79370.1 glycine dehydrogenase subunit 1 [Tissierella praeacuta]SHE70962.1 glycine dehydrogenase subunit 1 [Tissierella praeacuta DSM 18095]SUO98978.1 Probable glycine dehydrogenase [decarboxylating] subunit 1 [Tissierella praeacuta]